jgi:hypothetical protein
LARAFDGDSTAGKERSRTKASNLSDAQKAFILKHGWDGWLAISTEKQASARLSYFN